MTPPSRTCGCNWSIAPRSPISCWSTTSAARSRALPLLDADPDGDPGRRSAKPDVTVNLSADAAVSDYKIYVDLVRFSQRDAAALLAAMWKTDQRREATVPSASLR